MCSYILHSMSSKTKASLPVGSSLILDLKLKITKALLKALLHVREEKVFLMLKNEMGSTSLPQYQFFLSLYRYPL